MSSQQSSLAIEEVKEKSQDLTYEIDFEPKLEVLVNKRFIKSSELETTTDVVAIRGRITISF